jgi:hypothetical protein
MVSFNSGSEGVPTERRIDPVDELGIGNTCEVINTSQ